MRFAFLFSLLSVAACASTREDPPGSDADADTDADTDADVDTDADTDTGTGSETASETDSDTGTGSETDTATETDTGSDTDTGTGTDTGSDTDTDTGTGSDTETDDCAPGRILCDGMCVNPNRDEGNCGGCGIVCDDPDVGPVCTDGVCSCGSDPPCAGPEVCCNTGIDYMCVDTTSDTMNCGECGNECAFREGCIAGVCGDPGGCNCVDDDECPVDCVCQPFLEDCDGDGALDSKCLCGGYYYYY